MNIKKIIASILAIASISVASTSVFAEPLVDTADFYIFTANVNGTPKAGEKFTVDVIVSTADGSSISLDYSEDWAGAGCFASSGLRFSSTYLSVTTTPTFLYEGFTLAAPVKATANDEITFAEDIEIPSGSKIITYEFTVKDGVEPGTYKNTALWLQGSSLSDDKISYEDWTAISEAVHGDVSLTVASDAPQGPTATKVETAANGISEYTVSTGETVMMSQEFTQQTISEATRFVVTWNGVKKVFGSDLYAQLGGQEGDIVIGSLTFGLIVDGDANASDFTFEIK